MPNMPGKFTETLDLLGRRWALRLVWELRRDTLSFSELRSRLGVSPSVLSERVRELLESGVIERDGGRRYRLSGHGRRLARILYELNRWSAGGSPPGPTVSSQRDPA